MGTGGTRYLSNIDKELKVVGRLVLKHDYESLALGTGGRRYLSNVNIELTSGV